MSYKRNITKIVFNNLPENNPWQELTTEKLLFIWWSTGRASTSLRLTEDGRVAFELAEIAYYEYPLVNNEDHLEKIKFSSFVIELGKKIKCPFYVGSKNRSYKNAYIRLYDSKIAVMVSLYGSFHEYFDNLNI